MKVVIIGAGAMGCLYGAYLSKQNEVIMLDAYLPQVEAINQQGITVLEPDGTEKNYQVRAYESGKYSEVADLVIVFVKSTYTEQALAQNSALFGDHTVVMTLQNGAGNDRKIAKYVQAQNIVIGTSKHNSVNNGSGQIRHSGAGLTTIGSNSEDCDETLAKIESVLTDAGFETEVSKDIQRIIWSKLFVNLSINTFTAITRAPIGSMIDNRYAWDFAEKMICEAVDVAEADGTHFSYIEVLNMVHHVCEDVGTGYSSMYQDVKKGIPTEIDAINGAIVEQARLYNVPAPYNTLIVDLIHAIEGAYKYQKEQ